MKSFLYIFTFIITICSSVQSQNFNIEYGLPLPSAEECIGKAFEYKWHYVSLISSRSGSITKYSIIKINQNGDIVDTINLQDTTVFTCIDWVQGSDGYYYILTKETKNGEAYTLHLLKLNSDFNISAKYLINFEHKYPFSLYLREISLGKLAIFGNAGAVSSYWSSIATYYEVDTEGKVLNKLNYNIVSGISTWAFVDFTRDSSGNIYLLGYSYNETTLKSNKFILKYSSSLKKIWEETFDSGPISYVRIYVNSNNNIVCIGKEKTGDHSGHLIVSIRHKYGYEISKKSYFTYESYPNDCTRDKSGNFICSGFLYADLINNGGLIIKLSETGDSLWSRSYVPYISNSHNFKKIITTSDGGYLLAGSLLIPSDSGEINNRQAWLVKVDSLGYDYTTQWPDSIVSTKNVYENSILLYPNPTSGGIFCKWGDIAPEQRENFTLELYSILGQLVKKSSLNSQDINLSSFSSGIYSYIIRYKNIEIVKTGKIALVQSKQ